MPNQELLDQLYRAKSQLVIPEGWIEAHSERLSVAEVAVLNTERYVRGRRYLEVGVGKGNLFRELAHRGGMVTGIEPASWGATPPNVYTSLSDLPRDMTFDAIVANDVLEHVASPIATLSEMRTHAHETTKLYCRFPNSQSVRAKWRKERWSMVRPLGHLHYFSRPSIHKMFNASGWSVVRAVPSEILNMRTHFGLSGPRLMIMIVLDMLRQGDQWLVEAVPSRP